MAKAYINRIATAVPVHEVHQAFIDFAASQLDAREARLFGRMAAMSGIDHRYSVLAPAKGSNSGAVDAAGIYVPGQFPDTGTRMRLFDHFAPELAASAVERLDLGDARSRITHLVVTCCTGFSAPGIDLDIIRRCGLSTGVERTIVGFMGCYAAINAVRLAHHIVRSQADARVLVVNLELCSLHLQETADLEKSLCFLLFADGCAATLVSADPVGLALESFRTVLADNTRELITWHIRNSGFDMVLSGKVPAAITSVLRHGAGPVLDGCPVEDIDLWAVHPGGRSVLEAVERALELPTEALTCSREVLRRYGNMSSATVMFVLQRMLQAKARGRGCAMAFGPGLVTEAMLFDAAA